MSREGATASRLDAVVATFVGVLALCVSAYTAFMQRQQVRAQVWPILVYGSSNLPAIALSLSNKGVGPARIKHVVVTYQGQSYIQWEDLFDRMLGKDKYFYMQSPAFGTVLSPGESVEMVSLGDLKHEPLVAGPPGSIGDLANRGRRHIGVEVCYCSTLDDCWTLVSQPGKPAETLATPRCPSLSPRSFLQ
jgi:hypothetical protein